VLLTLLMVAMMEFSHPFFFLQDDNRTLYLPFYAHNLRAILNGEFPLYNFHQYLGTPVTIQYAALYPFNYLALILSGQLFGHYFAAMEIIAIFHLVVAALGFFYLLRYLGLAGVSCLFGSIAWTFCGFVIIGGNSWIQVVGFAAYLPWIVLLAIRQIRGFDFKCFMALVLVKALEFLLGYPQLFIYTMTLEFMMVVTLFIAGNKDTGALGTADSTAGHQRPTFLKVMLSFVANYACVFFICFPLILQTAYQSGVSANRKLLLSWDEYAAFSYNLKYWLHGLFVPFKPVDITTQFELHFLSHIGYLTILFLLLSVAFDWLVPVKPASPEEMAGRKQRAVFWLLALFSLCWAGNIIVTKVLYYVPVYNRLRFPFKVAFYTSFYLIIISAWGFDGFYRRLRQFVSRKCNLAVAAVPIVIGLHLVNFLVLYVILPEQMFSRHLDPVPLVEPLAGKLADGRVVSASLDDVLEDEKIIPGYSASLLAFNYATLWGVNHFGGYDPMVSEKAQKTALGIKNNPVFNLPANEPFSIPAETLEYFRKWGVKWYILNKAIPLGSSDGFKLIFSDDKRNVLFDSLARPMVYWEEDSTATVPSYRFTANSVKIDYTNETGGTLIINILQHPFFSASLDGRPIRISETGDSQVSLQVPAGRHIIILKYTDNYFRYGLIVTATFVLLLAPVLVTNRTRTAIVGFFS
jgi:hypothetical protein